ncbi:MAG: hypothetical protein ACKV0T_10240 [Planctomycetales bacterium]
MEGKKLLGWIKHGWTKFVDPERDERIRKQSAQLNRILASEKRAFSLKSALAALAIEPEDRDAVCESVYEQCVDRAWGDLQLSDAEKRTLEWVAPALQLSAEVMGRIHARKGMDVFGSLLVQAIQDGRVDSDEHSRLQAVAAWAGTSVRELVHQSFASTGAGFLRGLFTTAVEDGVLLHDEWRQFIICAERLGFAPEEAKRLVEPYAQPFVEHVLADAKADGQLSANEEKTLAWLLDQFSLSEAFREYVATEVHELRQFTDINQGRLPVFENFTGIEVRAGELVHFSGHANFTQERQRKSGVVAQQFSGTVTITDSRTVFSSTLKSFSLNHSSVISIENYPGGLEIRTGSKGAGYYQFDRKLNLVDAIWRTAVGRANQTIVEKSSGSHSRHIPRDVRQRVWQRYSGRCAECQSTQYLEQVCNRFAVATGWAAYLGCAARPQAIVSNCFAVTADRLAQPGFPFAHRCQRQAARQKSSFRVLQWLLGFSHGETRKSHGKIPLVAANGCAAPSCQILTFWLRLSVAMYPPVQSSIRLRPFAAPQFPDRLLVANPHAGFRPRNR